MTPAINIYKADGTVLMEAVVTKDGVSRESLMTEDCIALRWSAPEYTVLPEGAYMIDDAGERYRLIRPYYPSQKDEVRCDYAPEFLSRVMCWAAVPLFFYTYAADGETITSRESEWSLTATPGTFMSYFARVIEAETGERWKATVSDDIKLTTASVAFQSTDLLSGLNAVASAFGTEWRADKKTNTLHLGAAAHGVPVRLEVGGNVSAPSTTESRQEYGNRFYILGSSRNIAQTYEGANVNNLVTRRLTLDPDKYPGGYIDVRPGLTKDEIVPRYLTFDNIYPRSALVAYDVRCRLVYRLNESGDKIQIGTTVAGDPIYDQYAIWYFKAKDKITGKQYLFDPADLIERQALSVSFLGGALNGRDFELTYHDSSKVVNTSDGTPIQVDKGDFEINFVEEGSYIIPAVTALVPADGDDLTLFNINMPTEYHASAYLELEAAALEEIDRRNRDLNNYEVKSNPVVFYDDDPELTVGQKVIFVNVDGREIETRVLSIARKLDRPYEQTITLGNEVVKGAISEIKENVVNANTNLAVISQLQELNTAFTQAYTRAQQQLLENFARMSQIWKLDEDGNVYTDRNVYSYKDIVAGGKSDGLGGAGGVSGALNLFDLLDVELTDRVNGDLIAWNGTKWTNIRQSAIMPDLSGYATEVWVKAQGYLTQHQSLAGYATQKWVEGKGYALASELDGYLPLTGGTLTGPLTMGGAGVHRIYFKDAEHFIELDEEGNFHFSGNVYADGDIVSGGWQTPGEDDVPVVGALSDLTDVKLSELTAGDLIQWNGEKFVNVRPSELGISGAVDLSNYVTLDTAQTITGAKTFATTLIAKEIQITGAASATGSWIGSTGADNIFLQASNKYLLVLDGTRSEVRCGGNVDASLGRSDIPWNNVYANKFIKVGGTSSQFLKADGSVDGSSYLTGMPLVAPTANFQDYMAGLKGINWRSGDTTLTYEAMRATDAVLDVGNSYARFFRLMHNRRDGNLRFQGSTNADSASTAAWGTERTLLDSVNYGSYTVTALGVNGNYVTWTKNGTANNITVPYAINTHNIFPSGSTTDLNATSLNRNGIYFWANTAANRPGSYGVLFQWSNSNNPTNGTSQHWITQLASVTDGGGLYVRTRTNASNWMAWEKILTNANYATTLDGRYVTLETTQTISGVKTFTSNITCSRTGAAAQVVASRDGRVVSLHSDSNRGVYDNSGSGWLIGTNGTNTFLMRGNVGIGKTDPGYSLDANGQIRANGWLRTIGNVGWYNETHGGGWFMQDSTWIRTYNSKAVYTGSGRIRSDHLFDRQVYGGSSWNNGYGAYNIAIVNNSSQTPLLLAYRSGIEPTNATGANRLFSMEFLNNGTDLRFYFGGNHRFTFYSNGNFESSGDQVVGSSSDRRLKRRFAVEDYTERILRLGAVMSYEWNETARALDSDKYDTVRHTSVVWQRAHKVGLPGFCGVDERGYGFVNWLNKDYQASLLGAVQQTIKTVLRHDDEIRRLRRRVSELEEGVNNKCA